MNALTRSSFATAKFSTKCDGQLLLQSATQFITLRQEVQSANNITNCDSTPVHGHGGEKALHLRKCRLKPGCHKNDSLYTDVVLFFFSFFSSEATARERKIKNVCRHLWEKRRFIKSLANVNASSLSPPRSQYQLNWTNGTGDINCSCNWLKYFTINQQ